MAKHVATLTVPPGKNRRTVGTFEVKRNSERFETLAESQGTVVWFPRDARYGGQMRWEKFDLLMEERATRYKTRSWQKSA